MVGGSVTRATCGGLPVGCFRDVWSWERVSSRFGGVAQLGEHLLCKQGVVGSIPIVSTIVHGHGSMGMVSPERVSQAVSWNIRDR
jgi:hypothetical protein